MMLNLYFHCTTSSFFAQRAHAGIYSSQRRDGAIFRSVRLFQSTGEVVDGMDNFM